MKKFEVGQKWKQRNGTIVTVVFVNATNIVMEQSNGYVFISNLLGRINNAIASDYDLMEQFTEPKYRPFEGGEFVPKHSVVPKEIESMRAGWFSDTHVWIGGYYTWEDAFKKFTFEDGTPFGICEVKS